MLELSGRLGVKKCAIEKILAQVKGETSPHFVGGEKKHTVNL